MIKIHKNHFWFVLIAFIITFFITTQKFSVTNYQEDFKKKIINEIGVKEAFFTSKNNIRQIIVELIKNEKRKIQAALYLLTDKHIAQALIDARKNNIEIEIITCGTNLEAKNNKIWVLHENGIQVYIYDLSKAATKSGYTPLMHHKFIIFSKNLNDKSFLLTGSFNCTNTACVNRENVVLLEDDYLIEQFKQEFEDTKKCSRNIDQYLQKKPAKHKKTSKKIKKENSSLNLSQKFWNLF